MALDNAETAEALKGILWPGESVELAVEQRRIGPGGSVTTPTTVVATDKRLMIINKATLGIRQDYEVIPYKQITSVRLEHGVISSSVFIRVQGYDRDKGLLKSGKEEGEIDGLRNRDASALADALNRRVNMNQPVVGAGAAQQNSKAEPGAYIYCSSCGARCNVDAKFCSSCGAAIHR
ncbi:MAG: PH domain-containing protein [Candidatus Micrarchaeota archaeon]|nr:PH domain-containing protein [Candidatus Micrarchaeota archaeon]